MERHREGEGTKKMEHITGGRHKDDGRHNKEVAQAGGKT